MGRWLATLGLLICGLLMATAGSALLRAEELPWCVELDVFTKNCAFTNYDACATVARNGGGRCIGNPQYKPPAAAARSRTSPMKASARRR
jgi:hypothetical protein